MDLIVVASHPIQYQACIWRELANMEGLRFEVWYGSDYGVREQPSVWGPGRFAWDIDLTTGYPHRFLPNWSPAPAPSTYAGKLYPGLAVELFIKKPRAVLIQGYRNLHEQSAFVGAKLAGSRLLFRADTNARAERPRLRNIGRYAFLSRFYPMVDAILTIGPDNRRHYELHGVPGAKLYDAPYAIDQDLFKNLAKTAGPSSECRKKLGLPEDPPLILFAGRLLRLKGVDLLLRALPRLSDAHLAVVGSGEEDGALRSLADEVAKGRVHFLGFLNQTELARAYAAADVLCLPSRLEAWGLVVNEAIAMGRPVVVTDSCGVAADIAKTGAGLVAPSESAGALAQALHRALEGAKSGQFDAGIRAFNDRHHPRATAEAIVRALDDG